MGGLSKLDYSKIDPWIKKFPDGDYKTFIAANPKISISSWSFRKRRVKILGLPMCESMRDDYRGSKGKTKSTGIVDKRSQSAVYTSVYMVPSEELKKKNGLEAISDFIGVMNKIFKLNLESAQIELIGSGVQNFEIRRYSR